MMTKDEREMSIAYANLIQICELLQHIVRAGAYNMLSCECKKDFIDAEEALIRVKEEMFGYMSEHTDFRDGKKSENDCRGEKDG